jgi:signal transduction histidine kinase
MDRDRMRRAAFARWLRSLHVQLFLWAVMPVSFVIIAISFSGVYAHQRRMRDFVAERDSIIAYVEARVAADGLAQGIVGGDGNGLDAWMELSSDGLDGTIMVIDGQGIVLASTADAEVGTSVLGLPGIAEARARRTGSAIVQGPSGSILIAFTPVQGTDWLVVTRESVDTLIGPLLRLPSIIPIVAAGASLISLLVLSFGWRTIVRPLQDLARSAGQVSWGQYEALARPVQGVQEIRDLHQALADMVDRIRSYEMSMRDYLGAVTQATEIERARLARELHDGPVQDLIVLGQRAEMAQRLLERNEAQRASALLGELRRTEEDTVRQLRRLIGALRPIYLEDLGFVPALKMLVRQADERTSAQVRLEGAPEVGRLPPEVELAAYRIAQEALNNAAQHASARYISVHAARQGGTLVLTVTDDGVGFSVPAQPDLFTRQGHYGLLGIRERASQLGGTLQIDSTPGQGTRLTVRLPAQVVGSA